MYAPEANKSACLNWPLACPRDRTLEHVRFSGHGGARILYRSITDTLKSKLCD